MEADDVMEKGNEVGSGPRPHVATQGGGGPAAQGRKWGPNGAAASSSGGGWRCQVGGGSPAWDKNGGTWAGLGKKENGSAQEHSDIWDLFKIISIGIDLIKLKDGLPEIKKFK
jgi:hypothetical protein